MFNSNIIMGSLGSFTRYNLSGCEFDLTKSLKVKYLFSVGLPIYDFLLVSNSSYMSILPHPAVIGTWQFPPVPYQCAKLMVGE